jgi:hypothetical protein
MKIWLSPSFWEIQDRKLIKGTFVAYGVEDFSHTQENRAG